MSNLNANKVVHLRSRHLWSLTPTEFNNWRKRYDYPRILQHLKTSVKGFSKWLCQANFSENDLIELGLSHFLGAWPGVFVQQIRVGSSLRKRCSPQSWKRDPLPNASLVSEQLVQPFLIKDLEPGLPSCFRKFVLLNLGNTTLSAAVTLSERDLAFTCLDGLVIKGAATTSSVQLWYSSAIGLKVESELSYLDCYKTDLQDFKATQVTLSDWHLRECELTGTLSGTALLRWQVENCLFLPNLSTAEIEASSFVMHSSSPQDNGHALVLYNSLKRAHAAKGRYHEAGLYHYLARCVQRRRLLRPWLYYAKALRKRPWRVLAFWLQYLVSVLEWLWWGYGERPVRILAASLSTIALSSLIFMVVDSSATYGDIASSIYFSTVTFSTIGYGDIAQTGTLRLVAALEGLIGVFSMGLLVAGFSNKSRY